MIGLSPVRGLLPHRSSRSVVSHAAAVRCSAASLAPVEQLKLATADSLRDSVDRVLPESPYRRFLEWVLDARNPHHEAFLQCTGTTQTAKMNVLALEGLLHESEWPRAAPYIGKINGYHSFEVVSDNLALHLSSLRRHSCRAGQRRLLLNRFNQLAEEKLRQPSSSIASTQEELEKHCSGLSLFDLSLASDKLRALATAFVADCGEDLEAIESSIALPLIANIETCWDMVKAVEGLPLFEVTRQGEIDRYRSVNSLLLGTDGSLAAQAETGMHTILVVPTLAYYIDVLAYIRDESAGLETHRDDIVALLRKAAALVRLLNDLGTAVLNYDDEAIGHHLKEALVFGAKAYAESGGSIRQGLLAAVSSSPAFTRLRKDLEFGEFNLALWGIQPESSWQEAVDQLDTNLRFLRNQYDTTRAQMCQLAEVLQRVAPVAVEPARRFVEFHVRLYHHDFSQQCGEYAI